MESHSKKIISVGTDSTVCAALIIAQPDKIRAMCPAVHITLILDNARFQCCKEVAA